ncbi:uncharacterized protein LOC121948641 [Plectropomus leopardus]|uniref:uncharacterized protein LOC121948641 n=1 Tax=Plectropomus leopardus TaxID=160734 RepID=UPI001C4B643C|nr:uncharacterized protein LOC121948641 [Plectropomus leopardus]
MKDLSLSVLSRGCGRFVSSNRNTGRHDGRLDVCFTPQDYYIWKSQDSLLRLSNSGHLLVEEVSALPKTYSTRRGPLLLYSQDLVTMETSANSETRDRKQQVVRGYSQQVEQQLSNLKELTAAIMSYSNTQFISSKLGPLFLPPINLPPAPDLRRPSPPHLHTTHEQPSTELLVQLKPEWLPAQRNDEGKKWQDRQMDKEGKQSSRKRVRLDLFLQMPCSSRSPSPQMDPQPWVHYVATTLEAPEEPQQLQTAVDLQLQTSADLNLEYTESLHHTDINHDSTRGELHHPVADDCDCAIQDSGRNSDEGRCETAISGNRQRRTGFLPPLTVGQSVCDELYWEKTDRPSWTGPSRDEQYAERLPPIAESHTVTATQVIQTPTRKDVDPKAERLRFQPQENLNRLHQQPLFLPLLFPGMEEKISGKQKGGEEKTERQNFKKAPGGRGEGGRLSSEKGSVIMLQPGEEPPPPVGVLGCVAGRKGPGKQSSLAFLQNRLLDLQDPCDSSEANRGVVRGVLPLELRDLQNGNSVGSLILGPDGQIIQLSLYDSSQDASHGDGDTQEQALQVLSAEGEELPWVIVLQPEHTHTEGDVELNIDIPVGDIQHHQSVKLLDLHRSSSAEMNAYSPGIHTDPGKDPAAVTNEKTKHAQTTTETWQKDAKNNISLPPLREQVGKEEPRGGNTEAEDEDEEGELGNTGRSSYLSGSHQPGLFVCFSWEKLQLKDGVSCSWQDISLNEATTEHAADQRRQNTKRKDAEEAVTTTRKREIKMVKSAESDGQKTSATRREERWRRQNAGNDAPSIGHQKQKERSNREAAETRDHSPLPSVKKKMPEREGESGEVKMFEERKERGEAMKKKENSAGRKRRRRGGLKHKEIVVGKDNDPLKKEEVKISKEIEKESHLKSAKSPSATQRHNNNTKANSEEDVDTEHLSSNTDKHSSVRSVSSLRSAATSFNQRSSRRSAASSYCEGTVPASAMGLTSSHGRLSSCSTVMVTEEQLMLNPVKPESTRPKKSQEEEQEEAAALRLAQRAERRRQEVERKRREREEEERKQQEREQIEERMKNELEEERRKRAEELRLKKLAEEEQRGKREEEKQEQAKREEAQRERERRRQEERRRQMERFQKMREEEEQRRKAEIERLRLEEERRQEEESKKLQEMDEDERMEYLCRKEQEEKNRRSIEEERKKREEEAAVRAAEEARLQAELLTRQMALLQRQLAFKRGLAFEAEGLEKTQGISRPWIYSYFTLLQLLGLNPAKAETTTPDL